MSSTNQTEILQKLLGPLVLKKAQEKKDFDTLSGYITSSRIVQPTPSKSGREFEKSDAYDLRRVAPSHLKAINRIATARESSSKKEKYVMYKREQAMPNILVRDAIPNWANGAKPEASLGPFSQVDSRQVWFDFYLILSFSKLFFEGDSSPAILFKPASVRKQTVKAISNTTNELRALRTNKKTGAVKRVIKGRDKIVSPTRGTTVTLAKGSIWIQSKYLANGAPAKGYTGLTIKGGTITFSKKPLSTGSSYKISATTKVSINLELDQAAGPIESKDNFGGDAKDMKLKLTEDFSGAEIAAVTNRAAISALKRYGGGQSNNVKEIKLKIYHQ